MTILQIVAILLGAAENIVPVFVKNPTSQKIEGVIITTADAVFNEFASVLQPAPATTAAPASTT